jgi:hypothetical protein
VQVVHRAVVQVVHRAVVQVVHGTIVHVVFEMDAYASRKAAANLV